MEARFLKVTSEYLRDRMSRSQVGFVEGKSCHLNIIRLMTRLDYLRRNKIHDYGTLFIDFSSAYNTINRRILYERLVKLKLLSENENNGSTIYMMLLKPTLRAMIFTARTE